MHKKAQYKFILVLIIYSIIGLAESAATQSNDSRLLFAGDFQKRPGLGINLGPINSGMSQWVFTNKFKHAKEWRPVGSMFNWTNYTMEGSFTTQWSSDGYPLNFTSLLYGVKRIGYQTELGTDGAYPTGDYIVTFKGTGNIALLGDAKDVVQINSNKYAFTVYNATTKGIVLIVTQPNVTDIDLRLKKDENSIETFDSDYLNTISVFEALRFSAWMVAREGSNIGPVNVDWASRRPVNYYTQHGQKMVSVEYIVELANRLSKDIWLSIPSSASADYIRNFATYILNNIGNDTKTIYVEQSSDKGWNANNRTLQMQLISVWKSVFGANDTRVKYVLSTFITAYYEAVTSLYTADDLKQFHAYSVSGVIAYGAEYNFDGFDTLSSANYTVENITEKIRQKIYEDEISLIHQMHKVAVQLDIPLIGYDVGFLVHAPGFSSRWFNTSLAPLEQRLEDLIIEALRQPIAEDLYLDYMERWWKIGADIMFVSNLVEKLNRCERGGGRCGYKATLENMLQDPQSVPKYRAVLKWLNGTKGRLPFTSDDIPVIPDPVCNPACVWGTCFEGKCECFDGFTGADCNTTAPKYLDCASNNTEYGVNCDGIADWSTEVTFIDLQRRARKWIVQKLVFSTRWADWDQEDITLRDDGYPQYLERGKSIGTFLTRDLNARFPNGYYTCLFDGDGALEFFFADVKVLSRNAGRLNLYIEHKTEMNNGIYYQIIRTNPSNPIRNIRLFESRYEKHYKHFPYHPLFLSHMKKYQTIRFMTWSRTNEDQIVDWSNRTTDQYYTFTLKTGVSIEKQVALCNALGANAWFNLPHQATDDYITKWSEYVSKNLRPDVKIYIEVGNECWGSGGAHTCGNYAQKMGLLTNETISRRQNYFNQDLQARICYHARTGARYFDTIKQIFGAENRARLKLVLGTQAAWTGPIEIFFLCTGNYSLSYDIIAIAPYWSANLKYPNSSVVSLDYFFDSIAPNAINSSASALISIAAVVYNSTSSMEMALYEAGPDFSSLFDSSNIALTQLSFAIHRDERIYEPMKKYIRALTENPQVKLAAYMQYTSTGACSKYGCWGLIESSDANVTINPKYRAYHDVINSNRICEFTEKNVTCGRNCSYNGICTASPFSEVGDTCYCFFGSNGTMCENKVSIKSSKCTYQCGGKGVCEYDHTEGFYDIFACHCYTGYYGYGCTLFNCTNDCSYNGLCVDNDTCKCYRGFKGKYCDVDCGCDSHGVCANVTNECLCDTGFVFVNGSCRVDCSGGKCAQCPPDCVFGVCVRGSCVCWAGYSIDASTGACTAKTAAPNDVVLNALGINVNGVADWSTQWAFVDVARAAREWIVQHVDGLNDLYIWSLKETVNLTTDHYPAEVAQDRQYVTLMLRDVQRQWPSGIYHVFYEGDGVIDFGFDAKIVPNSNLVKGRMKINVSLSLVRDNGIFMKIKKSNPVNPLRNIRVVMDGFEDIYEKIPFHPRFVERLAKFKTIRFMPWTAEIGVTTWDTRVTPQRYYAGSGVAYEFMIELCNWLKTNCWLTVPYGADDGFIVEMAKLVKANLRKDVKVYVEYSNEAWGLGTEGGKYCDAMGKALNLSTDPVIARNYFYSRRSRQIIELWKSVYGAEDERVVLVLGSFVVMPVITRRILSFENASKAHSNVMVAITGYISCGSPAASIVAISDLSVLIDMCNADLNNTAKIIEAHANITTNFSVGIGMYESGSGMAELDAIMHGRETPGATDKYIALNRHSGMYDVYLRYYTMFKKFNLTENNHYAYVERPSMYGSWCLLEYQEQDIASAHRYRAIMDFIQGKTSDASFPVGHKLLVIITLLVFYFIF